MGDKKYMLKLTEETHKRAKAQAAMEGISLNDFIVKAIEAYLEKKGGK